MPHHLILCNKNSQIAFTFSVATIAIIKLMAVRVKGIYLYCYKLNKNHLHKIVNRALESQGGA